MPQLSDNKKAFFDYEIIDEIEAGIKLSGAEVKSAKTGGISLKGSYVHFRDNEAYLINAHISPYSKAVPDPSYNPERDRKLLLKNSEIKKIGEQKKAEGLTVVPLSIYTKNNYIKVKIALARGKRKTDKRESIKKRETDRKIRRASR